MGLAQIQEDGSTREAYLARKLRSKRGMEHQDMRRRYERGVVVEDREEGLTTDQAG